MWFNVAHYALRPWPWILTALASVILYPDLIDKEVGFIHMMTDHMPPALRGLMLASFLAAYMSTIATHLNWGASYFVNDFYQRFLAPNRSDRHYVAISRLATLGLMMIGGGFRFSLNPSRMPGSCSSISEPGRGRCTCCAGTGGESMPGRKLQP